jgi:ribosomal protein S18 acetylase RimI-like enzyme
MLIRRLIPTDAAAFQTLRLEVLRAAPSAFTASYEEESDTPLGEIEHRLAPGSMRHHFGAFDDGVLVAIAHVERDRGAKQRHRAHIRGVYVAAAHRGKGAGRRLMQHAIEFAGSIPGISHINLAVTAGTAPALALYESLGFQAWGYEPAALVVDGVVYDEIPMTKVLA